MFQQLFFAGKEFFGVGFPRLVYGSAEICFLLSRGPPAKVLKTKRLSSLFWRAVSYVDCLEIIDNTYLVQLRMGNFEANTASWHYG